jgi:hypothetical protein
MRVELVGAAQRATVLLLPLRACGVQSARAGAWFVQRLVWRFAMTNVREAFQQDHVRLDALFEELLNRVHVDERSATREVWAAFEEGLLAHMLAEERDMIPIFQRHDPAEAAEIVAEHGRVRSLLAELGVMLDIHALREETVEALITLLRAHAARENAALYKWADRELPEAPKASILERLRRAASGVPRGHEAPTRSAGVRPAP